MAEADLQEGLSRQEVAEQDSGTTAGGFGLLHKVLHVVLLPHRWLQGGPSIV